MADQKRILKTDAETSSVMAQLRERIDLWQSAILTEDPWIVPIGCKVLAQYYRDQGNRQDSLKYDALSSRVARMLTERGISSPVRQAALADGTWRVWPSSEVGG